MVALACGLGGAMAGTASAHKHRRDHHPSTPPATLFVSAAAKSTNSGQSCPTASYSTIQSAVNAAAAGANVIVCPGTYHEQVVIQNPINLIGNSATIDEAGVTPGLTLTIPGIGPLQIDAGVVVLSSQVSIRGFTVQNAFGEGILAAGLASTLNKVTIEGNEVVNDNKGGPPASTYFECQVNNQVPGDCGEGIHFINVAWSVIAGNHVSGNAGGILLTDETGPTHDNLITGNIITGNLFDCGITAPGHNPNALSSTGQRQPSVAGVYNNKIIGNVITGNGVLGEGAGVLFANAQAGTASYNNVVEHNYIAGNELAGVTMHAHTLAPGQFEDLSGNTVTDNVIGVNNTGGDPLDGSATDNQTTGVLVFSGGTPIQTTIADNVIFGDEIGIWLSKPVSAAGLPSNSFFGVTAQVSANN